LAGVWAKEAAGKTRREVLQEVLEEWLILEIRDNDPIPRLRRVGLSPKAAWSDGQADFSQRTDRRFRDLGFTGPISGGRHQFGEKGELKVRIPNPHKGGNIDWSLVKEILRQAGIKTADWDKA